MDRRQFMSNFIPDRIEWPTVLLIVACYVGWFGLAVSGHVVHPVLWIVAMALLTTLYWSLVHEAVHHHPTDKPWINRLAVAIPVGWVYAYDRFRDGHLRHHATGALTDPFDDPESFYLPVLRWRSLGGAVRLLLVFNNTLFGRMLVGPAITGWRMIVGDVRTLAGPDRFRILAEWLLHIVLVGALVLVVGRISSVSPWWFAAAAYLGVSILLIRTFLEHQASENAGERTVIIEDNGPLAFLFLYNNLHVVHHTRPGLAWYRLPGFYKRHRAQFIRRNNGYVYDSYWQIFRQFFFRAKEPVPHPGYR